MTHTKRRGRASDANLTASKSAEHFQGLPDGSTQYNLVRLAEDNGKEVGVGPAAIAHYRFLVVRWTQDRDWREPGERPVVFLSVNKTAEIRGLSEESVRQYEYELNEAKLLTWTDRGDYHRCGLRDPQDGRILFAHGVDLSPGAVMLPKLLEIDARRREELKERAGLRALISRLKGYVKPRLNRAIEDGLADPDNAGWRNGVKLLSTRTRAKTPLDRLKDIAGQLSSLKDTLNGLADVYGRAGRNLSTKCGKARKTCGGTRKGTDASAEIYRPIYITKESQTDKSVTSTLSCGQSTAQCGKADAPNGAKSSIETIDGRKNAGGSALESETETYRDDRCARGSPREPQNEAPAVNFDADAQTLGHVETRPDGKARGCLEVAVGAACGHERRTNNGNGRGDGNQYPGALSEKGLRASAARNEERESVGAWDNGPGSPSGRPGKGRLWKSNTGTRYLSPLNVVETAGPRMLAAVLRANRMAATDQPEWEGIEDAAEDLCLELGIGSKVWWMAVTVMGRRAAAICVMLIDRKMCPDAEDPVRSPGAYLHGMTSRARKDELHLHASVFGWARRDAA